uniref:SET domain-containing protein n=1 Tax=Erpetoichthys calabaricus TaxID=27687 RepID=A0A8C4RIG7_ERPCA
TKSKPEGFTYDIAKSKHIRHYVSSQAWKGLVICNNVEGKGRGVFIRRWFQKEEMVCDYHGMNIKVKADIFCKNRWQEALSIYAQTFPFPCHTDMEVFGRPLTHLSSRTNLQPQCFLMDTGQWPRDIVLFIAKKDIEENAELLFDYRHNLWLKIK